MRQSNPWVFGLVFLCIVVYLAFNNFELPSFMMGKTNETFGKIVDIKIGYGVRGYGYVQYVDYVYEVNGRYYLDKKTVGQNYGWQNIGNQVKIEYSVRNPDRNKVVCFYRNYTDKNEVKYYSPKKIGFYRIDLVNDIFHLTEFADSGKILKKVIGQFVNRNDTIIVTPYNLDDFERASGVLCYLVRRDTLHKEILFDIKAKREYR